ncbi:phage protein NinX family protein [Cedecea neteri]|uniref:phage protein NinX family protein n=1 Tax=Cedecea neteri TaxID=158822 RepID=UPI0028991CCC|nr:phage protein NinX family protein [Cedecea neteri]
MTDYSQMSDFEINSLVSAHLWGSVCSVDGVVLHNEKDGAFDPCNNPADAWPIIHDNLISINFDNDGYDTPQSSWCRATSLTGDEYYGDEKKPLRAAMIVFLMMQDSSNANPI